MNNIASWIWVLIPLAAIGIAPFKMWMRIKEKQIEAQTSLAAEKSAQYAQHMERVEARLRVLEQIVTDGGAQTAAQIEALRDQARIPIEGQGPMNPFEFVLAPHRPDRSCSHRSAQAGHAGPVMRQMRGDEPRANPRETQRLRDEVQELKERIKVLERITVEKENSLAKEIESLRDR